MLYFIFLLFIAAIFAMIAIWDTAAPTVKIHRVPSMFFVDWVILAFGAFLLFVIF